MTDPKRKPGRPPLPPEKRRSAAVHIDVHPDDLAAMHARATRAGKTLAGWARDVLVRAARR